jgi:hypothetical protein
MSEGHRDRHCTVGRDVMSAGARRYIEMEMFQYVGMFGGCFRVVFTRDFVILFEVAGKATWNF